METYVRSMDVRDTGTVKQLIEKTLLHRSMNRVYEASEITVWNDCYDTESLAYIAENAHTYLIFEESTDRLLASGYIRLCDDGISAHIGMIFSDPDYRGAGLGRRIVELLEQDEYAEKVRRIELLSSMSAYRFYRRMGYGNKDGEFQMETELGTYGIPMEKYLSDDGKQ